MIRPIYFYVWYLFAFDIFGADYDLEKLYSWIQTQFPNDQNIINKALVINKTENPDYFLKNLNALYQTVFDDKDNYIFAHDFIFIIKHTQAGELITKKFILDQIYKELGSSQTNSNLDKTLKEMSRFEVIITGIIFGLFLSDNSFDATEKYRKISQVGPIEALLLSINFVKNRRENWDFSFIIETMEVFKRLKVGGHFQAIKGALKIISSYESKNSALENWVIIKTIQLCYYNQNSFDSEYQKSITKLLTELKYTDKNDANDYFSEKALVISLKGDRYSFVQDREMLYNQCLLF